MTRPKSLSLRCSRLHGETSITMSSVHLEMALERSATVVGLGPVILHCCCCCCSLSSCFHDCCILCRCCCHSECCYIFCCCCTDPSSSPLFHHISCCGNISASSLTSSFNKILVFSRSSLLQHQHDISSLERLSSVQCPLRSSSAFSLSRFITSSLSLSRASDRSRTLSRPRAFRHLSHTSNFLTSRSRSLSLSHASVRSLSTLCWASSCGLLLFFRLGLALCVFVSPPPRSSSPSLSRTRSPYPLRSPPQRSSSPNLGVLHRHCLTFLLFFFFLFRVQRGLWV